VLQKALQTRYMGVTFYPSLFWPGGFDEFFGFAPKASQSCHHPKMAFFAVPKLAFRQHAKRAQN
jgi:hypothetical protein